MKYYLWVKQVGGCDYTIRCGEGLILLEGVTRDNVTAKAIERLQGLGWGVAGDIELEWARILQVDDVHLFEIDLPMALNRLKIEQALEDKFKQLRADEAEFERLKQKLGRP